MNKITQIENPLATGKLPRANLSKMSETQVKNWREVQREFRNTCKVIDNRKIILRDIINLVNSDIDKTIKKIKQINPGIGNDSAFGMALDKVIDSLAINYDIELPQMPDYPILEKYLRENKKASL